VLDIHGCVVAPRHAGIHGRSDGAGEHADDRWWRIDPTEKPRVAIAEWKWKHPPLQLEPEVVNRSARFWWNRNQRRAAQRCRHGTEDGPSRDRHEMLGQQIDRLISGPANVFG
jgi:hypothetical protein